MICLVVLFFLPFLNIAYIYAGQAVGIAGDAETYRTKGYEAQQRGDIDTAIEWYQKAANLMPEYASPHNDLGVLFETKGWLDKAEAEYEKALAIDPGYKEVHTNLALLYERKGELEKAAFHWMKRYKLGSPDDPWAQEAKTRLEKLGLLNKTEEGKPKTEQQAPLEESNGKLVKKEISVRKNLEKKQESEPMVKKNPGWTRIGSDKNKKQTKVSKIETDKNQEQTKASKTNKAINAELKESLRMAEERLKKEKAAKQNTAVTKKEAEVKTALALGNETSTSYNKAKDYYNKGEYAKALDIIRLAKQNSQPAV